jgi:membrane-associated phospholipid phosphatase
LVAFAWIALLLIALPLDRPIAAAMHRGGLDAQVREHPISAVVKLSGTFIFTAVVAILGLLTRQCRPIQSLLIVLAGIASGINAPIKWLVGRSRPFKGFDGPNPPYPFHLEPLWHGVHGLFYQRDLCFPSGHACTAFALATAVALVRPKWGWVLFVLAVLVGAERILENAHYLSDVIGAAGIGAGATLIVWRLLRKWLAREPSAPGFPVVTR